MSERQSMLTEQTVIWSNLLELLECKKKCIEDAKQNEGSITITKQAETLTL